MVISLPLGSRLPKMKRFRIFDFMTEQHHKINGACEIINNVSIATTSY